MKKIFFVLGLLVSLVGNSQTVPFPTTQWSGSATTLFTARGGMTATVGFINSTYSDTTSANTNPYLKYYIGAQIYTTSDNKFWVRNSTATAWQVIGGTGSGTVTSVGLSMPSPSSPAFSVSGSPVTGSGTLAVSANGTTSQYVRGDGSLATYTGGIVTASNGLTLTGTNVKWGGTLIDATTTISIGSNSLIFDKSGTEVLTLGTALSQMSSPDATKNLTLNNGASGVTFQIGSDATGDTYYRNASGLFTRLPIGTSSQILIGGTIPAWSSSLPASILTASNGLTRTGSNIAMGGSFTGATSITNASGHLIQIALDEDDDGTGFVGINYNGRVGFVNGSATLYEASGATSAIAQIGVGAASMSASITSTASSGFSILPTSFSMQPHLGNLTIDTLANLSTQNVLMGWTTTSGGDRGEVGYITAGTGVSISAGVLSATGTGGTVTSIATTSPITGGTITSTGTIACATCVTSAAALTANQIVIGAGSQGTAALGSLGTTTTVLHGNAAGAPTFGAVSLTADVSGVLPIANGGTGAATTSQNFAFIGPTSGSGAPSFRALVEGDIPSLSGTYLPLAGGTMVGNILATDNTYDIGATGATRFRSMYLGTQITVPTVNVSTKVLNASGTAAAPSYSFTSDSDNGLFLVGGNSVGMATNGTETIRFGTDHTWFKTPFIYLGAPADLILYYEAAATLQLGTDGATPIAQTFKAMDGTGTNIAGSQLTVASGRSTGTGLAASILFQTGTVGTSGAVANALATRMSILGTGEITFGGNATAAATRWLEPSGSGTNYSSLSAGAQAANADYIFPTGVPANNGDVLTSTTAGQWSWTPQSSIVGATPTLQQVITAGATLTGNNSVAGGGFTWTHTNASSYTLRDATNIRFNFTSSSTSIRSPDNSNSFVTSNTQNDIGGVTVVTGTLTIPTPFTLGATSVTSTGTQLNYLNAATGTTGTASTNLVYSTSPALTTPTVVTSIVGGASFDAFNTVSTTLNLGGAATTMTIGGTPTTAITHNYSTNATATATTKTLNIGTGGAAGSTTNINVGSAIGGTLSLPSPIITAGTSALVMTLGGGATAAKLRFLEPSGSGSNYSEFQAVAQGANITYSLPPTVGAAGTVLTDAAGNGVLTWASAGGGGLTVGTTAIASGTDTRILYQDASKLAQDANLTWNGTGLGIGTAATVALDVNAGSTGVLMTTATYTGAGLFKINEDGSFYIGDRDATVNRTVIEGIDASGTLNYRAANGHTFATGNVRMSAYTAGAATFDGSGNITSVSDGRAKHNIQPFKYGLDAILKINPSTFIYNQDKSNTVMSGFIAQDVQKAIPIAVHEGHGKDAMMSLETNAILAALVNGMKEQQKEIETLKAEIKKLKRK